MPHECQTAGVSFPAVLATESDTEGNDPIYSLPKTGKISRIKSDKVQNSYEKNNVFAKNVEGQLKNMERRFHVTGRGGLTWPRNP